MAQQELETDYLIIGAGAMGMAFADTLFHEAPGTRMVIVDRRAAPGGHWTDAYPHVSLHQPAMFYGVNSQKLEHHRTDLASGAAIVDYYRRLMARFTASGRVQYLPLSEVHGDGEVRSRVGGPSLRVLARKRIVDAGHMNVQVPAMRPPPFPVSDGARVIPPNGLNGLSRAWERYVVMGGGKTGIDAVLFLLDMGIPQADIHWVVPNDSWFWSREVVQAGLALSEFLRQMDALVRAESVDEMFLDLERQGSVSRLSREVMPSKWRCATISRDEHARICTLQNVVRMGRVQGIDADRIVLEHGEMPTGPNTLHIDCTANGLARLTPAPVFAPGRITLQSLVMCQQVLSAAMIARLSLLGLDDDTLNALFEVVPHPEQTRDLPTCLVTSIGNLLRITRRIPTWLLRRRLSLLAHESLFSAASGVLRAHRQMPAARDSVQRLLAGAARP